MIAINTGEGMQEPPDERPDEGSVPTGADVKLIQQAVNERWPLTDQQRQMVMRKLLMVVRSGEKDRDRVAAAQAIAKLDAINVKEKRPVSQHVHFHGDGAARQPGSVVDDAEYIEFVAGRDAPDNVQPGSARSVGNGWKMGSLSAPAVTKPPANGPSGGKAAGSG